jgi:hypothetical protein
MTGLGHPAPAIARRDSGVSFSSSPPPFESPVAYSTDPHLLGKRSGSTSSRSCDSPAMFVAPPKRKRGGDSSLDAVVKQNLDTVWSEFMVKRYD